MLKLDSTGLLRFTGAFYARRARRILPALLVCLSVIAVAAALFIPSSWLAKTNQQTTSYAFWGLSNYFMMHYGDPYFAPRIDYNLRLTPGRSASRNSSTGCTRWYSSPG